MNNILLISVCTILSLLNYLTSAQNKTLINVVTDIKNSGIHDCNILISDYISYQDESMLYHEFTPHTRDYLSPQYPSIDFDKSFAFGVRDGSMLYHELTHIGDCSLSQITLVDVDKSAQHDICSIYPNPASEVTKLEYSIEYPSKVVIELFDIMSNSVVRIEDGEKQIGQHNILIDTQTLNAGVYYCKLNMGGVVTMKKLLIIR